jgi:LacI family transcriptional regulator, purine nucleotide synthesis repressor
MKKTGNITLATLAEKLNVTTTTVSKALHGKAGIGTEMVKKVQDLARELNYQPNFAAQSLKKSSSDSIGLLITSDITNPWYAQLVSCIESELSKRGKTMILSLGKDDYEKERNCLEAFRGGRVAGVIVGPIFRQRNLENIWQSLNNGLPMVLFNCMDEMPVDYVAVNQAEGARVAVNHLIDNGHKRIGYLCCPDDLQETGKTRREGFERALFDHDMPLFGRDIVTGATTKKAAYKTMKELLTLDREKLPTAFFCHNDTVALGAMLAIQQAGLSVPEDISLIGFDDIEESSLVFPALTTVGGIKDKFAKELVSTILNFVENRATPQSNRIRKEIAPELIIRDSVKKL